MIQTSVRGMTPIARQSFDHWRSPGALTLLASCAIGAVAVLVTAPLTALSERRFGTSETFRFTAALVLLPWVVLSVSYPGS